MTKLIRTFALMSALAVLAGGTTIATAQVAKEKAKVDPKVKADPKAKAADPKEDPKTKPKTKAAEKTAGSIEVYMGKNGFRYRVKNADGKTILMPLPQMSWETKEECMKAIKDAAEIMSAVKPMEVKE